MNRKRFSELPAPIRKRILGGCGISVITLLFSLVLGIIQGDGLLIGIGVIMALIGLYCALSTFASCSEGSYIVLEGICESVMRKGLRRRRQIITMKCEGKIIRLHVRENGFNAAPGSLIRIYIKLDKSSSCGEYMAATDEIWEYLGLESI